jgi:hypothetical protein
MIRTTMSDDDRPLTFLRALRAAEFWLLLVTAIAAGCGVSAQITIPATIAGLLISSLPKYVPLRARAKAVGAERMFWATVLSSILIATVASIATFVLGRATWWLWGL